LNISKLKKCDIWALGCILFCLVNPDLKSPYTLEFQDSSRDKADFLTEMYKKEKKPKNSNSEDYYLLQIDWINLVEFSQSLLLTFNPEQRINISILVHKLKLLTDGPTKSISIPLACHQGTALEKMYQYSDIIPILDCDASNGCIFWTILFLFHLKTDLKDKISPESLEELGNRILDEEPTKVNQYRDKSQCYDVFEAYKILKGIRFYSDQPDYDITETMGVNKVFSLEGKKDLYVQLDKLPRMIDPAYGIFTCGNYSFFLGHNDFLFFIYDTHCITESLGGNGNGIIKLFKCTKSACAWIWKRLDLSGVKNECFSFALMTKRKRKSTKK